MQAGDAEAAAAARRLIDVFENAGVECVAINAAGCGSAMKSYGELLRDDPAYAERARAFAAKCVDMSGIAGRPRATSDSASLPMRVAYHGALPSAPRARRQRAAARSAAHRFPASSFAKFRNPTSAADRPASTTCSSPIPPLASRDRESAAPADDGRRGGGVRNPGCLMQIASGLELAGRHDQDDASGRVGRSISSRGSFEGLRAVTRGAAVRERASEADTVRPWSPTPDSGDPVQRRSAEPRLDASVWSRRCNLTPMEIREECLPKKCKGPNPTVQDFTFSKPQSPMMRLNSRG